MRAAAKASPAPVESRTRSAWTGGTGNGPAPGPVANAPRSPRVVTTHGTVADNRSR